MAIYARPRFECIGGRTTSSKVMPRVSEHLIACGGAPECSRALIACEMGPRPSRLCVGIAEWHAHLCPMFTSFRPTVIPGESPSTINPVNADPVLAVGSVLASTKNQLATPPAMFDPIPVDHAARNRHGMG